MNIGPKMCDFNVGDNGQDKTLQDEPGIPELMELYLDDNYDYQTGEIYRNDGKDETSVSKGPENILQCFYGEQRGSRRCPKNSAI